MEDLFDEIEQDADVEDGAEGTEKKKREVKPSIPIQINDRIRVVLMSDRKNLQVQLKVDKSEVSDEEVVTEETEDSNEDFWWKGKGYYGTRAWKGVLNKVAALVKEEKLSRTDKADSDMLNESIRSLEKEVNFWAKEIISTLITNKINL